MRSLLGLLAIASAIVSPYYVNALQDSAPLVAWTPSSKPLTGLLDQDRLPSEWPLYKEYVNEEDLCRFDVVVFITHPGVRAADLRGIDSSSTLYEKFSSSGQNITIANVPFDSLPATSDAAESLARRCAAEYHEYAMERGAKELGSAKRLVLHVIMSPLTGFGRWRKELMSEHIASLSNLLDAVEELSFNHAILYSSSPLPHHSRRQSDSSSPKQTLPEPFAFAAASPSATGIFARYQLLTPGLITALLAVFFVIVPLVVLAVQALASIESSVRLEAPKIVSQERKSQ